MNVLDTVWLMLAAAFVLATALLLGRSSRTRRRGAADGDGLPATGDGGADSAGGGDGGGGGGD